jgi:hypothetical protein
MYNARRFTWHSQQHCESTTEVEHLEFSFAARELANQKKCIVGESQRRTHKMECVA